MLVKMYSIFDEKAGLFSAPYTLQNDISAIRSIKASFNDNTTTIGQYPSEFILFCIGDFDDNLGQVFSQPPRSLGLISQILSS